MSSGDPEKTIFHYLAMKLFGDTKWADHFTRAGEVPIANLNVESIQSFSDNLMALS